MKRPARLQDIADALHVNISTVSRSLSGHPSIPPSTRKKVQKKAAQLGYRPDPALRRLTERRWATHPSSRPSSLAFVVWSKKDYPKQQADLKKAARTAAIELGYGFESIAIDDYPTVESAVQVMEARGICGVAVLGSESQNAWAGFPWDRFSAVHMISGEEAPTGLHFITYDSFGSLLDAGARIERARPASAAIGLISQTRESMTDALDHAAALLVTSRWKNAGIPCKKPCLFKTKPNVAETIAQWLIRERVGAVIIPNDGIAEELVSGPIKIPAHTNMITLWRQGSSFAGYERQLDTIAIRAMQKLDSMFRHDERGLPASPQITLIPSLWVPGKSFPE